MKIPSQGVTNAKVLVVGDFPTVEDERRCQPFCGGAGDELRKMLQEAGFLTTELRFTYACKTRPFGSKAKYAWTVKKSEAKDITAPTIVDGAWCSDEVIEGLKELNEEILSCNPNVIIALGDFPLWALTKNISITKWRGSALTYLTDGGPYKVIPTYAPSQILKVWQWRAFSVRDMQRAFASQDDPVWHPPKLNLQIRPTFDDVIKRLKWLIFQGEKAHDQNIQFRCSVDIETIARNIACIGVGWSKYDALCIPFMIHEGHYFTLDEETMIIQLMHTVMQHPGLAITGQNFSYDMQHILRSWAVLPHIDFDTMLAQHICFPGIPKDLAFLGSMYIDHYVYWKDDLDDYRSLPVDLDRFWTYNCKDCVHTYEIAEVLKPMVKKLGFQSQLDFLMTLHGNVQGMMRRGIKIDTKKKGELALDLMGEMEERKSRINFIVGREINLNSPKQLMALFYDELGFKPVKSRKTYRPSADNEALDTVAIREPAIRPLVHLINETRSIGVFLKTFVMMPLDFDKRMRCDFKVGGTETFRFSSSKNPFGSGGNLQNVPKGDEDEVHQESDFIFPNLRRMFIPDYGHTLFDVDLSGADAQIVAWEADDADLKAKFRSGEKIHALNAKDMYGTQAGSDGKKQPYYAKAKMGCHLSNYGGTPYGMSKALGMTIHEAEVFQRRWFQMHPGIKEWHERVEHDLMTTRSVRNKFGFRRFYFDRIEGLLPEALAWVPQSTVAIIINTGLNNICASNTSLRLMLQVHDSLVGQFPTEDLDTVLPILQKCLQVTVPYDDPLIIGTSLDLSTKSWGDLISRKWND